MQDPNLLRHGRSEDVYDRSGSNTGVVIAIIALVLAFFVAIFFFGGTGAHTGTSPNSGAPATQMAPGAPGTQTAPKAPGLAPATPSPGGGGAAGQGTTAPAPSP